MTEGSYISFGVEGVPYSQVRVELPLDADMADRERAITNAVYYADILAAEYARVFPETRQEPRSAPDGLSAPYDRLASEYEPGEPVREPYDDEPRGGYLRQAQGRSGPPGGSGGKSTGLFCPDHPRVELVQSIDKYQRWDEGPSGARIPAVFFCPGKDNGTGANHTIYRSKAVAAR